MKCIAKIKDEDFGIASKEFSNPVIRYSARGIVINDNKQVAILFKSFINEYKLVGGGLETGESFEECFTREVKEETGYNIIIDKLLGYTEEYISLNNFQQKSYIFVAHTDGKQQFTSLTDEEIINGSKTVWLDIEEALNKLSNCDKNINNYEERFIIRRDLLILKYFFSLNILV